MSKDKLRILIKILAENHMSFDLGHKIDIQCTERQTSPTPFPPLFKACCMRMLAKCQALGLTHAHEEGRKWIRACVFVDAPNVDVID